MRGIRHARLPLVTILALAFAGLPAEISLATHLPPLNGKIAFTSTGPKDTNIFVMNADGSGRTQMTDDGPFTVTVQPAWSPDGTKIAFSHLAHGFDTHQIVLMNADGSGRTALTSGEVSKTNPAWSPEGEEIAFEGSGDIYVMDADGTDQRNLTNNTVREYSPTWSPDGTRIAFFTDTRGMNGEGTTEIFVMNADGSGRTNITNGAGEDSYPAWSPDGTKIAFNSIAPDGWYDIFVMAPDGSGRTNLTRAPGNEEVPVWSPDGTLIAFNFGALYVMNADGSGGFRHLSDWAYDVDWQAVDVPVPSVTPARSREGRFAVFEVSIPPIGGFVEYAYTARGGRAKRGKDYKRKTGVLRFVPEETVKYLRVKTKEDAADEPTETFFLEVSYPRGPYDSGKARIVDDD